MAWASDMRRLKTSKDMQAHYQQRSQRASTKTMHVWGPVLKQHGNNVGALGQAFSFCLNVLSLLPSLLDRVKAVVPDLQQKPDEKKSWTCKFGQPVALHVP